MNNSPINLHFQDLTPHSDPEKVREILLNITPQTFTNQDDWLKAADMALEAGEISRVPFFLNLALKSAPNNPEILRKLANFHQDSGNPAKAEGYWQKLLCLCPDDLEAYLELGNLYGDHGDLEKQIELYHHAQEKTGNPLFREKTRQCLPFEEEDEDEHLGRPQLNFNDSQLITFLSLFSGREGVHARQWSSPTGESGYTPVKEPLTPVHLKNHLLGNYTLGVYQIRLDQTVCFIALDLDLPKKLIPHIIGDAKKWERAINTIHQYSLKIVDLAAAYNLSVYLEDSGFKGRHCWFFLAQPLEARLAKKFAQIFLRQLPPPPVEVEIEIFPKQGWVKPDGLGNLIKLPLGLHRKSGKKSWFIDPQGIPYPDPMKFLEEITPVSWQSIYAFLKNFPEISPDSAALPINNQSEAEPAAREYLLPTPPEPAYDPQRDPEVQFLLVKCPALKKLWEKAASECLLSHDEIIVLTHTLAYTKQGVNAVNYALSQLAGIEESYLLKSPLRGNPMSCPKIRSRLSGQTSRMNCNCVFPQQLNMYPTPLLHLSQMPENYTAGAGVDSLQFQNLIQNYLKTRREIKELLQLQDKYQQTLDRFFANAGLTEINTSFGLLKQVAADKDGQFNYLLEI